MALIPKIPHVLKSLNKLAGCSWYFPATPNYALLKRIFLVSHQMISVLYWSQEQTNCVLAQSGSLNDIFGSFV